MIDSNPSDQKQLVYFADPMCSWCYGFSPAMSAIAERFGPDVPIRLVMGGLRAGNTVPMRDKDKEYIQSAWQNVAAASGQPFDFSLFDRQGWIYDTEPACRAVVTMRRMAPDHALAFMARIQQAFYAQGQDVTKDGVLAALAGEFGIEPLEFAAHFTSAAAREETWTDFAIGTKSGVRGFPTLLAGTDAEGYSVVTNGFAAAEPVLEALAKWVAAASAASTTPRR